MRHIIDGEYRRFENRELAGLLGGSHRASFVDRLLATLHLWRDRRRMRRQMARDMRSFNDAMFEDAGTTRRDAEREVGKPFWRA